MRRNYSNYDVSYRNKTRYHYLSAHQQTKRYSPRISRENNDFTTETGSYNTSYATSAKIIIVLIIIIALLTVL